MPRPRDLHTDYRRMYAHFLLELQERIRTTLPRTVLVMGFGGGPELHLLTKKLPAGSIVAVDTNKQAIIDAKRRLTPKDRLRTSFINADIRSDLVQREIQGSDLIVGFFVLHLLGDSRLVTADWYHYSPDHTQLILADWCNPGPCPIFEGWTEGLTKKYKFESFNPDHPNTSGAVLRVVVKS